MKATGGEEDSRKVLLEKLKAKVDAFSEKDALNKRIEEEVETNRNENRGTSSGVSRLQEVFKENVDDVVTALLHKVMTTEDPHTKGICVYWLGHLNENNLKKLGPETLNNAYSALLGQITDEGVGRGGTPPIDGTVGGVLGLCLNYPNILSS